MKFKDMEVGMRVVVVKESDDSYGSYGGTFFKKGDTGVIVRLLGKDSLPAGAYVEFDKTNETWFAQHRELAPLNG